VAAAAAAAGGASSQGGPSLFKQRLLGFIQAHYLPLALLAALLLGATCPSLGVAAAGLQIPMFTTFGIFVVQVGSVNCCLSLIIGLLVLGGGCYSCWRATQP
jgi:hypothetical protein